MRTIGLTERIHVFTPLSVKGWKGPQAFAEAQAQRRRQAAEGGNEPASPKGHEQVSPLAWTHFLYLPFTTRTAQRISLHLASVLTPPAL